MIKLRAFQFTSITYRLVFACLMAAVVIYGSSYYQIRALMQQVMTGWINQIALSKLDAAVAKHQSSLHLIGEQGTRLVQMDERLHLADQNGLKAILPVSPYISKLAISSGTTGQDHSFGWHAEANGQPWQSTTADVDLLNSCNVVDGHHYWAQHIRNQELVFCTGMYMLGKSQQSIAIQINMQPLLQDLQNNLHLVDAVDQSVQGQPYVINRLNGHFLLGAEFIPEDLSTRPNSGAGKGGDIHYSLQLQDMPLVYGFYFSEEKIQNYLGKYFMLAILSMGKDMLLMCIAIALVSRQTTKSLRSLSKSTEEIAQGNLDTELTKIPRNDEVGRLSRSFRRMRDSLKLRILELQEATAARQRMESELAIAAQIQQAMLPSAEAAIDPRYSMSTLLQPARVVGGDLYDFFHVADDRICMVIGDVANKGMPAALFMARTLSLMRTLAHQSSTPAALLFSVNRELAHNNPECRFVTMFFAMLDLKTGSMQYASAGHDAPLLLRDGRVSKLPLQTGPALGLEEEGSFPQFESRLHAQDIIILYTDGITDARNEHNEEFSEARLQTTISQQAPAFAADIIRIVTLAHQKFIAQAPQFDDLTLLSMQFHPEVKRRKPAFGDWQISLNGQPLDYEQVKPRLAGFLRAQKVSDDIVDDLQLITEEVLVNVLKHGATEQDPASIRLDVHLHDSEIVIDMVDNSHAYNPLNGATQPDLEMDFSDRPVGGLGLYLVNALADHIDYNYAHGQNNLHIRKYLIKP
ncbi:SpoIIE family protein phosphatase [Undibacterium sp.]|uniref:ATP-binding SpoIIE family protein phosphatase n=1 Tax=Undibacterium sp. TaxID=1914977 RepID=UPI00273100F8|nr:SpoIIE family protein phosphatase [Undibacterium sp.]MDP1977708.1 SpoIIE family protein phosphatase [Undibacterium sp.]